VTDIAGRLAKLSKWDELAKRAQLERAGGARGAGPAAGDAPFRDVIEAAGRVVRRHAGMAVVLALEGTGDAVRVAEHDGEFVVELVKVVEGREVTAPTADPPPGAARAPESLPSDLARLLRRNPGLMSGWPPGSQPPAG
jgi:hypothetical protein